jgi:hypothetical protein
VGFVKVKPDTWPCVNSIIRGANTKAVISKHTQNPGIILRKRCHKYRSTDLVRNKLPAIRNPLKIKNPFTAIPPKLSWSWLNLATQSTLPYPPKGKL